LSLWYFLFWETLGQRNISMAKDSSQVYFYSLKIEAKGPLLGIKHLWYPPLINNYCTRFCDIQNNQGRGRGYQRKPKACYSNSNNSLVTKSNNCFIIHWTKQKKSCVCFFTDGNKTKRVTLTWLPLEILHRSHAWHGYPWPWHDYCIICSYDVTGADFRKFTVLFWQSEKRYNDFNV